MRTFRADFESRLRYFDGHADMLGMFADGGFLERAADTLAEPLAESRLTKVAGVEARGFVLGTAVALRLGVGFVPVRKEGAIHPGPTAEIRSDPDWRGRHQRLRMQRAGLGAADRVAVVDDWAETGSQARAARWLIEDCGAEYAGLSLLVNQLAPDVEETLAPVHFVVRAEDVRGDDPRFQ
jgi:adenine phosphoribosyltransferase